MLTPTSAKAFALHSLLISICKIALVYARAAKLTVAVFFASALAVNSASGYVPGMANLTVSINVPEASDNELFFNIFGPARRSWIAWGFGSEMKDSLIFVAYTSESGRNITVSPRLGRGHQEPKYIKDVDVEILNGTLVNDEAYSIQMKCTNCRSWSVGSGSEAEINVKGSQEPMIFAVGDDGRLQSDNQEARITKHIVNGLLYIDLSAAVGPGGVPELGSNRVNLPDTATLAPSRAVVVIHGLIMGACFVVLFPIGALLIRFPLRFAFKLHLGWQLCTFVGILIGFSFAIYISVRHKDPASFNSAHQGLGFSVVIILLVQPVLGYLHHRKRKQTQSSTLLGTIHKYLGPFIMCLGIINGALGLDFAGRRDRLPAYFGFVIFIAIAFLLVSWVLRRKSRHNKAMNSVAANNFRRGQAAAGHEGSAAPGYANGDVPLQRFAMGSYNDGNQSNLSQQSFSQAEHAPPTYANVVPKNDGQRL